MDARRQGRVPRLAQVEKAGGNSLSNQSTFRDIPNSVPQQARQRGASSSDGISPAASSQVPTRGGYLPEVINLTNDIDWANGLDALGNPLSANLRSYYDDIDDEPRKTAQINQGQPDLSIPQGPQYEPKQQPEPLARRHQPNHFGGVSRRRQRLRQLNAQSLACIANKDTISKDNTIGEEAREAILLINMARKIGRMAQQTKKLELGNGERWDREKKVRKKSLLPPPVPR